MVINLILGNPTFKPGSPTEGGSFAFAKRLQLVSASKSDLQRLEFQLQLIQDLFEDSDPAKGPRVLAKVEDRIETMKGLCSHEFSFSECKQQFLGRKLLALSTKVDGLGAFTQNC
jgi:hypothetical protein